MRTDRFDLDAATEVVDGVHLAPLSAGEETSVQGYRFDPGAAVPSHDHRHEQAGYLARGELTFHVPDGEFVVRAGDSYVVDSDEPHRVVNTGDVPAVGVDVFAPPRDDPDWA